MAKLPHRASREISARTRGGVGAVRTRRSIVNIEGERTAGAVRAPDPQVPCGTRADGGRLDTTCVAEAGFEHARRTRRGAHGEPVRHDELPIPTIGLWRNLEDGDLRARGTPLDRSCHSLTGIGLERPAGGDVHGVRASRVRHAKGHATVGTGRAAAATSQEPDRHEGKERAEDHVARQSIRSRGPFPT